MKTDQKSTSGQYSAQLLDHWVHPRNPGALAGPDGHGRREGICGDIMEIFIRVHNNLISEASYMTDGCTTTIATGSAVVELATGKTVGAAQAISGNEVRDLLGGLPAESHHCAELAADTLQAAIGDYRHLCREPWKKWYRPQTP